VAIEQDTNGHYIHYPCARATVHCCMLHEDASMKESKRLVAIIHTQKCVSLVGLSLNSSPAYYS
jgi:hypothetical protein